MSFVVVQVHDRCMIGFGSECLVVWTSDLCDQLSIRKCDFLLKVEWGEWLRLLCVHWDFSVTVGWLGDD